MAKVILAVDQGTTGTRSYLFDREGKVVASGYREFTQYFPKPGWVEHDGVEIWNTVEETARAALRAAGLKASDIAGIGITNQRETTLLWDRKTGRPKARAVVWQCRRTAERCRVLKEAGKEPWFRKITGLVLDAYFSGPKVEWLLNHTPGLKKRAFRGEIAFGTIDSWLLWNFSRGAVHATDYSNASRTLLFDIRKKAWSPRLCRLFGVPSALLPQVKPSSGVFGVTSKKSFLGREIPLCGVAGDQQAALYGQGCHAPGDFKNTYGTGAFLLLNLGNRFLLSKNKLLTTLGCDAWGKPVFVLEGSVFIAGAALQWIRDGLGLIRKAAESEDMAEKLADTGGVYLVPAFVGLGAPYWDSDARGIITGLTRGTRKEHVVRAALESLAYQTKDVVEAMQKDARMKIRELRVDGGACRNNWLMQFQADLLGARVNRPKQVETTAQGAAFLAGLACGFWKSPTEVRRLRKVDRVFSPSRASKKKMHELYSGWREAVRRALK